MASQVALWQWIGVLSKYERKLYTRFAAVLVLSGGLISACSSDGGSVLETNQDLSSVRVLGASMDVRVWMCEYGCASRLSTMSH